MPPGSATPSHTAIVQQAAVVPHLKSPSEAITAVVRMATWAVTSVYQAVVVRNGCQYAYYR
jgi:hypothetical protein